ncbi:hypothetical protein PpBr36_00620 [Pyricularia pennisetigena]|uniref:hypothetical protein n=1 Tax=Pyricularia pennisetigena TaxID=1578925 RepID=UPI00114FAEE1|nr:hypothetical protein PpBr36_00620 [Pyricularia pennisetigena]TLS29740.1 hypothetical protein PpBr36_00620 [Pyricularia pennisetigena]
MFFSFFVLGFNLLSLAGTVLAVPPNSIYKNKLYVPTLMTPEEVDQSNGFQVKGREVYVVGYADLEVAYSEGAKKAEMAKEAEMANEAGRGKKSGTKTYYIYHLNTKGVENTFMDVTKQDSQYYSYTWEPWEHMYGAKQISWESITGWDTIRPFPKLRSYTSKKDYEKKKRTQGWKQGSSGAASQPQAAWSAYGQAQAHASPSNWAPEPPRADVPSSSRAPPGHASGYNTASHRAPAPVPFQDPSSSRASGRTSGHSTPSHSAPQPARAGNPSSGQHRTGPPAFYRPFTEEIGFVQGPGGMVSDRFFPPWNPIPGMPQMRSSYPPPSRRS